jgi:site-specific DNA recombinase
MSQESKKAVIYCRVSSKEQVEDGNSLVTQERICTEYAKKNGYEIAQIFIEKGESAKNADRTQLKAMLAYCTTKKNSIEAVISYKVDRVARNIDDYRQIRLILKKHDVEIKSTTEHFEDNPAGRFMENIIANVAQFDNEVRTERSVGGMREAIREGRFVWGASIGYANSKVDGKPNIVPNAMAPLVLKSFVEVAKNMQPVYDIHKKMIKVGLVNKKGRPVSQSYFYHMLSNELYTGWIVAFGERYRGSFDPIVPRGLFAEVQQVMHRTKERNLKYKRDNDDFPLRRFIALPSGRKLTGCWVKGRAKKYPYYLFHSTKQWFKKQHFDDAFMQLLDQFKLSDSDFAKLKERLLLQATNININAQKEKTSRIKRIAELKQQQNSLIQKNLNGIISDSLLKEQLDSIDAELFKADQFKVLPEDFDAKKVEMALNLAEECLKKPSMAWLKAPLTTKLGLQRFYFPKGLIFDENSFRTDEVGKLFKGFADILSDFSYQVHPMISLSNPLTLTNAHYRIKLENEINELASIMQEASRN